MLALLIVLAQDAEALRALGGEVVEKDGAITKLSFRDCAKLGEGEYRRIGSLKGLKSLTLYGGKKTLTDETLPLLTGLAASLEELNTEGTHLTDAGLAPLAAFRNVRSMSFFHPSLDVKGFDGSGFSVLKELPKLERLTIAGTRFNDKGMEAVAQIVQLRDFRTWHTHQTQSGNAWLEKLPALRSLHLGQRLRRWDGGSNATSLDDATLEVLCRLQGLESLTLDEARISLGALSKLKSLPKLRTLDLQRLDLAAEDLEKLKAALPEVKVTCKPMTDDERKKLDAYLKP
jgi:hypothetical protein